jgi:site-specific DNA-methyltransferase (adenine-specific)
MKYKILQGDNRETLKTIPNNSIDAIITDPPYGIDFLGKAWDANTGALETYQECLRVLKPGGHIVAFSAARTYHYLAITLEQAGFEIRDQIMWIYSSGFPKSQDIGRQIQRKLGIEQTEKQEGFNAFANKNGSSFVSDWSRQEEKNDKVVVTDPVAKQWEGWGTSLKPAHEPIALARKPISEKNIAENCQKYGTGALNIDATRVPYVDDKDIKSAQFGRPSTDNHSYINTEAQQTRDNLDVVQANDKGRFPSNVIGEIADDYQKYFYCPKVNRKERHIGLHNPGAQTRRARDKNGNTLPYAEKKQGASANVLVEQFQLNSKGNNHPTVKPVELMKYLIKLITPPGGVVLDPFNGSGSTGMAAVELGHEYIGCELDPAYVDIATKRIEAYWELVKPNNTFDKLFGEA